MVSCGWYERGDGGLLGMRELSPRDSHIYEQRPCPVVLKMACIAQQPIIYWGRRVNLVAVSYSDQVFLSYSCLLPPLNLIFEDTSPINSPNSTHGDMKMNERHFPWRSYGRWWCPAIYPCSTTWKSKRECCFPIVRRCRRVNLLPLAIVKSATPSPASVTVSAGLLQIWHRQDPAGFECMYYLDFKVEYEYCPHSLLESDGFTVAIVPQPSFIK